MSPVSDISTLLDGMNLTQKERAIVLGYISQCTIRGEYPMTLSEFMKEQGISVSQAKNI